MENQVLHHQDLSFCVLRLPRSVKEVMKAEKWQGKVYVAGGYIRSVITNEKMNDVDLFVGSKDEAHLLALELSSATGKKLYETDNAITILCNPTIQVIHRWTFPEPVSVRKSFDFTICSAVIYYDGQWKSDCDPTFYQDLAAKRLVYKNPERNEDAGGSLLRVLKYYQKGYRIPIDSLGLVVARTIAEIDTVRCPLSDVKGTAKIITGLLRIVDPNVDPTHEAHLPIDLPNNLPVDLPVDEEEKAPLAEPEGTEFGEAAK
jgi:hypothetical protein